ncbi:MAG: hypothetical protein ABS939_04250 [Psychrobacillus sp.]
MKEKLLAIAFALVLFLPSHAAFASEKETITNLNLPAGQVDLQTLPLDFQDILAQRTAEINRYFEKIEELKIQTELAEKEVLEQNEFGTLTMNSLSNYNEVSSELEYYQNNSLEIVGLEKISNDVHDYIIQPLSTNTQASVSKPTVYYDNDSQSYVASTDWNWKEVNPDNNNKGRDGIGIHVAQEKISLFDSHVNSWDYNGNKYSPSNAKEGSANGYHIEFDDNSNGKSYSAHRGTSWMFFRWYDAKPVGKTVNFNSQYTHTWSGINITGVTVGVTSIGISFSGSGNNWKTTNYSAIKF